jgi:hypothetical protein
MGGPGNDCYDVMKLCVNVPAWRLTSRKWQCRMDRGGMPHGFCLMIMMMLEYILF